MGSLKLEEELKVRWGRKHESRRRGLKEYKQYGVFGEKQVTSWPKSTFAGEQTEGNEAGFPCQCLRSGLSWRRRIPQMDGF